MALRSYRVSLVLIIMLPPHSVAAATPAWKRCGEADLQSTPPVLLTFAARDWAIGVNAESAK